MEILALLVSILVHVQIIRFVSHAAQGNDIFRQL